MRFQDLLKDLDFTMHLNQMVPRETAKMINCKYYDESEFNSKVKSSNITLSLIHVNLQSSYMNYNMLKAHLEQLRINFDIIAISEAGLGNADRCAKVFGDDYFYDYNPPILRKGGVAVFINKKLTFNKRSDLEIKGNPKIENLWYDLEVNDKKFVLGIIYRHPGYSTTSICDILESNLAHINSENKLGLICGDINIDLLKHDNPQTKMYVDTLMTADTIPLITLPTRITPHSATLIDHINLTRPDKLKSAELWTGNLYMEIADHLPNFIIIKEPTINTCTKERPLVRIYSEKNKSRFKREISCLNWEDVLDQKNCNEGYDKFIKKYSTVFNRCFPLIKLSKKRCKDKKWITVGLKVSIKHKNRLYKKSLTNPSEINVLIYKRYKAKLRVLLKQSEKDYLSSILIESKQNTKNIWKVYREVLNKCKNNNNQKVSHLIFNNNKIENDQDIANSFNKYFSLIGSNLAKHLSKGNEYQKYMTNRLPNNMFLTPITEHELFIEINKLSQNKAPGIDNIPSGIIKLTTDFITTPLTHIFNTSFDSATVPDSLKTAKVIPVYKTNEKHSPGNYRPISLLSIFNKLLEKLMYKRLFAFLNQFNILEKYQFGFRRGYSTTMAVTEIIENIRKEIDKGNSVLSVHLDLSKAFLTWLITIYYLKNLNTME